MGDLLFLNYLMANVPKNHLGKILALRLMVFSGGNGFGLIIAAPIFSRVEPSVVVSICGALMALCGICGVILFGALPPTPVASYPEAETPPTPVASYPEAETPPTLEPSEIAI
jgi:hypothetical protein